MSTAKPYGFYATISGAQYPGVPIFIASFAYGEASYAAQPKSHSLKYVS